MSPHRPLFALSLLRALTAPIQARRTERPQLHGPHWITITGKPLAATTSILAADENGWMVSITPSGGWVPAVIAGRTGLGLSQLAQSFVTDAEDGPYNGSLWGGASNHREDYGISL